MNKKNLISHTNDSVNAITTKDVSTELAELSDKDLQQIVGGLMPEHTVTLPDGTVITTKW